MVSSMSDISEDDVFSYTNPLAGEVDFNDTSPKGTLHPNSTDFAHIMEEGKVKPGSFRKNRVSVTSAESPNRLLENRVYDLSVNKLTYKVTTKSKKAGVGQEKILLNMITARANHSQILAVVGPSGSSKTTFLDALAGRIERRSLKGTILVNGNPMDDNFKRVSGYVMQDDALFPVLTARETLLFTARLRLPGSMPRQVKMQQVEALIEQLGLEHCAETRVGSIKTRGLSGGERRRVSIGVDLIHDPAVLFLDEPTSGLDSTSALHVMQILSKMAADRCRTVVVTTHQPSFRILETINNVLVLAGGHAIYHGSRAAMTQYFMDLGKQIPGALVTYQVNAVEYALDIIEEFRAEPDGLQCLIEYHKTHMCKEEIELLTEDDAFGTSAYLSRISFATSFASELLVLLERSFINVFRTKELFLSRLALMILAGLTVGTVFFHAPYNVQGIQDRTAAFTFSLAVMIFTSTEALPILLDERQVFIRETSRGSYRTSSYVVAHALVLPPFLLCLAIIFTAIHYFLVGLVASPEAFFFVVFVYFITLYASNAFVAFVSSLVPNFIAGMAAVSAGTAYFFLFSGFFIPRRMIPNYWMWLHYLSLFKYPYELCLDNEFRHLPHVSWGTGLNSTGVVYTITSSEVLSTMSMGGVRPWLNFLVMLVFALGYRVLFYLALRFHTKAIRK